MERIRSVFPLLLCCITEAWCLRWGWGRADHSMTILLGSDDLQRRDTQTGNCKKSMYRFCMRCGLHTATHKANERGDDGVVVRRSSSHPSHGAKTDGCQCQRSYPSLLVYYQASRVPRVAAFNNPPPQEILFYPTPRDPSCSSWLLCRSISYDRREDCFMKSRGAAHRYRVIGQGG